MTICVHSTSLSVVRTSTSRPFSVLSSPTAVLATDTISNSHRDNTAHYHPNLMIGYCAVHEEPQATVKRAILTRCSSYSRINAYEVTSQDDMYSENLPDHNNATSVGTQNFFSCCCEKSNIPHSNILVSSAMCCATTQLPQFHEDDSDWIEITDAARPPATNSPKVDTSTDALQVISQAQPRIKSIYIVNANLIRSSAPVVRAFQYHQELRVCVECATPKTTLLCDQTWTVQAGGICGQHINGVRQMTSDVNAELMSAILQVIQPFERRNLQELGIQLVDLSVPDGRIGYAHKPGCQH